jgi:hypothetical protein
LRTIGLFDPDWEFYGAIHGTPTVLRRDPRCNFIEGFVSLGLSIGVFYMISAVANSIKTTANEKHN